MSAQQQNDDFQIEAGDQEIIFRTADRGYRVRGLEKNITSARLHVNLKVDRLDAVHVDNVDLYSDRARRQFVKRTSEELYVAEDLVKRDLARILRELETLQLSRPAAPAPVQLSDAEHRAALELLEDPQLLTRILKDFDRAGAVGEETGKLLCYVACVSRLLPQPLAVLIQSSSAAGKTTLMDATLKFFPSEEQVRFSAMTGQSLFYMGREELKHKILAAAEEEGVLQASYALKLLQSDGKLTLAAAERDGDSGRQRTQQYQVEGPVMMFLTTTAEDPDPELQNRCLTLNVNESPEQTAAIHCRQRAAYAVDGAADCEAICRLHQNAQRLLKPFSVVIPWAEQLTFRADQTRYRRDHAKYLSLIAALALLHQHQRERIVRPQNGNDETCIVAAPEDVETAGRLLAEIAGASLNGLLPQTRQLLVLIDDCVNQQAKKTKRSRSDVRFTQRELREAIGWSDRQLRRHITRLVELEYVLVHRLRPGNRRQFELVYGGQGQDGRPFLLGLADPAKLRQTTPTTTSAPHAPPKRPLMRPPSAPHPAASKNGASRAAAKTSRRRSAKTAKK